MSKSKKAILFLDQYSGLSGGQKVLLNIIQAFSKEGYKRITILPEKGLLSQKLEQLEIETIFFPIGSYSITQKNLFDFLNYSLRLPILVFLLIDLIIRKKIDVVYANGARTFIWATLACVVTKRPIFWHIHSIFENGLARKICVFFGKFQVVKKIFIVSKIAAEPLDELNLKLEVIYNAVQIPSPSKDFNLLKKEYGLLKDDFLVGNIGILEEWKNQEDLIRSARLIKDSGKKNIYFFIIGDSLYKECHKQKYKNRLKKMVSDMDLEKEVIFTGFRNDINEVMNSLDALVICSKKPDPCPLVSLEAASLGVAMISTDFGGVREIFKENEEVLFYKPGDFKNLANKIVYLFENRQFLQNIGQQAHLKVNKEYNLDNFLKRIINTVNNLTNGN